MPLRSPPSSSYLTTSLRRKKNDKEERFRYAAYRCHDSESGCLRRYSTGSDAGTDSGADSGSDSYKIALIQQHQTNAFQIAVSEAKLRAKADELGVDLTILSADQDAATQISQIERCVSEGYDAILFEPVDPDGLC